MTSGKLAGRARLLLAVAMLAHACPALAQDVPNTYPAGPIVPNTASGAPAFAPPQPSVVAPLASAPPPAPAGAPPSSYVPPSNVAPPPYAQPPYAQPPYAQPPYAQPPYAQLYGQPSAVPVPPFVPPPAADPSPPIVVPPSNVWTDRIWFGTDYLMWWTKAGHAPPLITQGSSSSFIPGALGDPGTQVLFGGSPLNPGMFSGLRLNGGFWFNDTLGVEGSFFSLAQRSITFNAGSNSNGFPVIARPVFDVLSGTESSYIDSYPGLVAGGSSASFSSVLRGFELNLSAKAVRSEGLSVDAFVGYRQLSLNEGLLIQDSLAALQPGFLTFAGRPADPPTSLADFDSFNTSNNFYGPQVGTRANWSVNRWNFNLLGKLAMGVSQQLVTINGASAVFAPGAGPVGTSGGILAQNSNIGRYFSDQFAVVPEIGLNLGYQLSPRLQLKFGYTFIFWSSVARPGDQIDRRVNAHNVPTDGTFGTAGGPALPTFTFNHSGYWAQGLNFGLEFRN